MWYTERVTLLPKATSKPKPRGTKLQIYNTTVVNIMDGDKCDIAITRGSRWGNPYVIGKDGTREEVLAMYETYLTNMLKHDPNFLEPLRGKVLGCVCKPLGCHGDIIVKKLSGFDALVRND